MTTVIRGGVIVTEIGVAPVVGDLVIRDGVVAGIEPAYRGQFDVELDAERCLVLPGLTNAHVHPGGSPILRGIAEDEDLPAAGATYHHTVALRSTSWEVLTPEENAALVEWEAAAMLLGGATNVVSEQVGEIDAWLDVVDRLGFRSDVGRIYPYPPALVDGEEVSGLPRAEIERGLAQAVSLYHQHHGKFGGRLSIHLAPHGPNTVPENILRETKALAAELGTTVHMHVAQHPSEEATVRRRTGLSPVAYLDQLSFLGDNVVAAHATYTSPEDWDILARSRTTVVHCPYRKAKEGITSPFAELIARNVNVCLGTETYCHDLIDEFRMATVLGKIRSRHTGVATATDALRAATAAPAQALGRADLGHLRPGARGDATVIAMRDPFISPAFDVLRNFVYYGRSGALKHTVVDGRPVVRDGMVVGTDVSSLGHRVDEICRRVWDAAVSAGTLKSSALPVAAGLEAGG